VNILDTNVLSHLQKQADPVGTTIAVAMAASPDQDFRITTINALEMLEGAFDKIRRLKQKHKALITGLQLFHDLLDYLSLWQGRILRYDDTAERIYLGFPPRLRQELQYDALIAAIALAQGAAVWTRNVSDFRRVPGLMVYAAETGARVS
jgi:predicted nucleic acid-binding protein